jgi:hypothetical protein
MSYTRSYHEVVSKTVSVSYPKSDSGGTTSVTVDIPVDVNIHVDTLPFDKSVHHCDNNVDLLTAAVVATESAEIISKEKNSAKVGETIVGGFFSYIRSEISQQVAELKQSIDAQLMHLKELSQACLAKKTQMEGDYNRISSRYGKIFEDLNNELSNRITELDKNTFLFKRETDNQNIRTTDNDLVTTVAIFGAESGDLQSKLSASIAKKRALDTLNKAIIFLLQQKQLNSTIRLSMLNENTEELYSVPICFVEFNHANNQNSTSLFIADQLISTHEKDINKELVDNFRSGTLKWETIPIDYQKTLGLFFDIELNTKFFSNDPHSVRVRERIQKIINLGSIKIIKEGNQTLNY